MQQFIETGEPILYIGVIWGGAYWLDAPTFFVVALVATVAVWARIVCQTR